MLDEVAPEAILRQILSSDLRCPIFIDQMIATYLTNAIMRSRVMVGIGVIDESDAFLLDGILLRPPRHEA